MEPTVELTFPNVLSTYNALWDIGGSIAMTPSVGDHDNWLLTYRDGLRGMLARVLVVDRHYVMLQDYQSKEDARTSNVNPNEWILECEYHAGVILFGMDSSLECFVFALNAIGFAKDALAFCNISDPKTLRQIGPKNILGGGSADKLNPRIGYARHFPNVTALWTQNKRLLSRLFEYHDVSKHRSAVAQGGNVGELRIRESPKDPNNHMSSVVHTMQTLSVEYQAFMANTLVAALEDIAAAFGFTVTRRS